LYDFLSSDVLLAVKASDMISAKIKRKRSVWIYKQNYCKISSALPSKRAVRSLGCGMWSTSRLEIDQGSWSRSSTP